MRYNFLTSSQIIRRITMAISSVNFQKTKPNSTAETTREFEAKYLLKKEYRQENSYWNCGKSDREIYNDQRAIYDEAKKGRGKRPSYENCVWEAVVNFNADHTLEDMKKVAEHIAEKFNIIPTRIAMHRDEGHLNSNGEVVYNYHAHLNFVTLKDAQQNWTVSKTKNKLSDLQTEVAEILGMERGKFKSEAKRLDHKQYRAEAKAREQRTQEQERLNLELENTKEQLKILSKKEIKEQLEAFRKENIGQGLAKEFFKKLSEDKKKLLAEPTCTQEQLDAYLIELRESNTTKEKRLFGEKEVINYEKIIQEQQQKIRDLNAKNDNLKQIANKSIEFIDQKVKIDLNAKFDLLKQQNEIQLNEQLENERKKLKKAQLEAEQKQKQASENFNYFLKRSRELRESQAVKEAIAIKDKEIEDIKAKNDQKISELKTENEATKKENMELHNENKDLKTKLTRYKETIKKLWNKYKSLLKDKLKHKEQDFKQTLADNYNNTKKLADEFKEIIPEPKKYRIMWIANDGKAMARYFTQSQYNKLDDELKAQCKLIENEPKQQNTKRERKGFQR